QQKNAYGFAVGLWRHAGSLATCAVGKHAHPDGRDHFERPELPSERDRVVDRATAGIQHDSFALELMIAREIIEIAWGLGGDDADCADPARQFGWQATQLNFIGNLRSSRATPAYAEQPSMATRPSNAMQRVGALSNIQARVVDR